jgi:ribose transport system permease protein
MEPTPKTKTAVSGQPRFSYGKILNALGPFLGLVFVITLFSLDSEVREYFLTVANFKIILTQTVIVALGALGMTMIIVSGGIDLSVGSGIALCSVVGALLIQEGWNLWSVFAVCAATGVILGAVNGGVISFFKMTPFIVTLGMLGIARGVAKWLAANQTVNFTDKSVGQLMLTSPKGWALPSGVWITFGLAIVMVLVMRRTVYGRYLFAIGSNESTARLCGAPTTAIKWSVYMVSGVFVGLAGLMQLSRLRQGDPTVAVGLELDIIAAVVIGGASLNGGAGSVLGSMIGALIMAVLRNGSQQMGWETYAQEIIIGLVIVLAVGLDRFRQSRQLKS